MNFKYFILIILSICFIFCHPVSGTEDSFQYHDSDDIELPYPAWDKTILSSASGGIISGLPSGYTYNRYMYVDTYIASTIILKTTHYYPFDYMSFMDLGYLDRPAGSQPVGLGLYGADGVLLAVYDLRPAFLDAEDNNLIEIVIASGAVYQYTNGEYKRNLGVCSVTPYYYSFYSAIGGGSSYTGTTYKIDSVSNDGFILGIGTSESPNTWINTASNDKINVGWTVKAQSPYNLWTDYTYQIITTWLDSGEVINTTTLNKNKPCGYINYSRANIMGSSNYGTYKFELTKDGTAKETIYLSFVPIGSSGALSWEKSSYVPGEIATVTYTYSSFDPVTYNYYIKTYDINTGLVDNHILSSASGTENILIDGWATGSYYSLLTVEEKSSGNEYSIAFDTFDISDSVIISGITYDVTNNISLGVTDVNFTQATAWYNTTSNISGNYNLTDLSVDIQITANASKTGYYHEEFLYTPIISGMYEMDLYLFPTIERDTHAIEGVIIDDAMYQAIPGAKVNIWNSTYSDNTTSNHLGYYRFDDLWCNSTNMVNEIFNTGVYGSWVQLNNSKMVPDSQIVTNITTSFVYFNNTDYLMNYTAGTIQINASGNMTENNNTYINYSYYLPTTYYVNSTADGYDDSIDYKTVVNSWTVQNIPLRAIYSLNITSVDSVTGAKIQEFTVVVDSESRDITNGTTTYYKNYGIYTITVSSDGYYSSQENVIMDRNRDVQLSLLPVDSEYYHAHYVEFVVCSIWGTKYSDVTVNVYNSTDTSGDTLLNGTTGTNGAVSFRMDENIRYTMVFTGGGIVEKTINIYPKNERYYIIVSYSGDIFEDEVSESNIIGITVKHYPGVNGSVDVSYNDVLDNTTALNFTIKERLIMGNFTTIATYNSFTNMSDAEHRFVLADYSDKEFIVIVNYTHAEYGERQRNFGISYGNNIGVLNEILSPFVKGMLAVFLLFSAALIFGATNREIGAVLVSIAAAILHSMHYFDYFGMNTIVLWAAISLAIIVSIAANFGKKGKEEGY